MIGSHKYLEHRLGITLSYPSSKYFGHIRCAPGKLFVTIDMLSTYIFYLLILTIYPVFYF